MVRTKLVPKRVRIRRWPPREPYTQFKIKTLLPEQKTVQIKKKRTSNKKCHSHEGHLWDVFIIERLVY